MADVIRLLPDSIASQIAAGEVIQRPASVVKELMENSIDADSNEILLVIKDAGKVLIQVSDNGKGMSDTDSRMCFERHATSKIQNANDIFKIKTKGFRGEALASIAAISHVELITRQKQNDVGTKIVLIGSKFKKQELSQSEPGTKISVKNLFFNVPARRKFLKSDAVELKHITDEFIRLALAHIDISFSFYHNGKELFRLLKSNLKQRISEIFGRGYDSKLLPIHQEMEILKINGFIGKINAARKSRTNQFLFVNNRYIKSNYLNHAITSCYREYIPEDQFPLFFLFLEIDPDKIDVNIHPTKQEIKFEDERLIYNYVKVAIKHILGKFTYTPSFDFDKNSSFDNLVIKNRTDQKAKINSGSGFSNEIKPNKNQDEWEKAFEILKDDNKTNNEVVENQEIPSKLNTGINDAFDDKTISLGQVFQLHNSHIVKQIKSGFILVDQKYAHERILYEEYLSNFNSQKKISLEQLMFPHVLNIDKTNENLLKSLLKDLEKFGFNLEEDKNKDILVKAVPANMIDKKGINQFIERILDDYLQNIEIQFSFHDHFARSLSKINARNKGEQLSNEEMNYLVDNLFNCENPYVNPNGKKTFIIIEMDEIIKRFNK